MNVTKSLLPEHED